MRSCVRIHKLPVDMAAKPRPTFGMRHVTVVPTNFEREDDEPDEE